MGTTEVYTFYAMDATPPAWPLPWRRVAAKSARTHDNKLVLEPSLIAIQLPRMETGRVSPGDYDAAMRVWHELQDLLVLAYDVVEADAVDALPAES